MTEDDTFDRLRRAPFESLEGIVNGTDEAYFESMIHDPIESAKFFGKFGWTMAEIEAEFLKRT